MTDYSDILISIRQETQRAHVAMLNKRFALAEASAIELLRLSARLLDVAEQCCNRHLTDSGSQLEKGYFHETSNTARGTD